MEELSKNEQIAKDFTVAILGSNQSLVSNNPKTMAQEVVSCYESILSILGKTDNKSKSK